MMTLTCSKWKLSSKYKQVYYNNTLGSIPKMLKIQMKKNEKQREKFAHLTVTIFPCRVDRKPPDL